MAAYEQDQRVVGVVDDDKDIRDAIESLLLSVGLRVQSFGAAAEFLESARPPSIGCLVVDVRLPGKSGLDFYEDLVKANVNAPCIFISGHADVPMSVRAMKAGAVEFLTKPVRHQDLLDAIQSALEQGRSSDADAQAVAELMDGFQALTPREREVMALVATGLLNKQIAAEMGVSEATVKLHRRQVMRKMQAQSLAELVRMADRLRLSGAKLSTIRPKTRSSSTFR
jgi:FixJ family two-component response regulator